MENLDIDAYDTIAFLSRTNQSYGYNTKSWRPALRNIASGECCFCSQGPDGDAFAAASSRGDGDGGHRLKAVADFKSDWEGSVLIGKDSDTIIEWFLMERGGVMRYLVIDIGGSFIKYALMDQRILCDDDGSALHPKRGAADELVEALGKLYDRFAGEIDGWLLRPQGIIDSRKGYFFTQEERFDITKALP